MHSKSPLSQTTSFLLCPTGDNGSLHFWDWNTGYNFQKLQTAAQPGSLDSEAGIYMTMFDHSGCRLLTAEADKTIKVYKEDETAVRLLIRFLEMHSVCRCLLVLMGIVVSVDSILQ